MGDPLQFRRSGDDADQDLSLRRGKDVLSKLLADHPEWEQSLRLAQDALAGDRHHAAAMHAVARSLQAKRINVFISYRSKNDAAAARALAENLRELSCGKLDVTFADEFAGSIAGQSYKKRVAERVKEAHWFLLLASDHQLSPWCMFETGMFLSTMVSERINKLICIRHPSVEPPSPIEEFQSVFATTKSLSELLAGLLQKPGPLPGWEPLNPQVAPAVIEAAAAAVADLFARPRSPTEFNRSVEITIQHPTDLTVPRDLDLAPIQTDTETARMFGMTRAPETWGELVSGLGNHRPTDGWLVELTQVFRKASQHSVFRPVTGTFESFEGSRMLRPIVHSMEPTPHGTTFRVLFVDDLSSAARPGIDPRALALLTAIRVNNRIRWEVFERYRSRHWDDEAIDSCASQLSRIDREAAASGGWNIGLIVSNFPPAEQLAVLSIANEWGRLRASMATGSPRMSGELDQALERRDVARLPSLIQLCGVLSSRFLSLTNAAADLHSVRDRLEDGEAGHHLSPS